jgi:hypothetical protein
MINVTQSVIMAFMVYGLVIGHVKPLLVLDPEPKVLNV